MSVIRCSKCGILNEDSYIYCSNCGNLLEKENNNEIISGSDNIDEINKLTNYADSVYLDFLHDGDLPDGTRVRVYVGDRYDDYDRVNVYYYNQDSNTMDTIHTEVEVLDGYVEFELEHCSEFIITRAVLNNTNTFNWFMPIAILEFVVIVGYVIYVKVFKKKVNN